MCDEREEICIQTTKEALELSRTDPKFLLETKGFSFPLFPLQTIIVPFKSKSAVQSITCVKLYIFSHH